MTSMQRNRQWLAVNQHLWSALPSSWNEAGWSQEDRDTLTSLVERARNEGLYSKRTDRQAVRFALVRHISRLRQEHSARMYS